jgi:hypothetical protein
MGTSDMSVGLQQTGLDDVDGMYLAHDRDQLKALVNKAVNLPVPCKAGNSFNG